MTTSSSPEEKEILSYFQKLSNWRWWGDEDQLGTLNFLTPQKIQQSVSLVADGTTVSCARPVVFDPTPDATAPAVHYMVESGEGWETGQKVTSRLSQAATDYIGMVFHGYTVTHIDSLAHFFGKAKCTTDAYHILYQRTWGNCRIY